MYEFFVSRNDIQSSMVFWVKTISKITESSENGGIVLGELALLYNCRRTATVRALTTCVLWSIDRHTFRQIMISTNQSQRNMHKMFLRKVIRLQLGFFRKSRMLVTKIINSNQKTVTICQYFSVTNLDIAVIIFALRVIFV